MLKIAETYSRVSLLCTFTSTGSSGQSGNLILWSRLTQRVTCQRTCVNILELSKWIGNERAFPSGAAIFPLFPGNGLPFSNSHGIPLLFNIHPSLRTRVYVCMCVSFVFFFLPYSLYSSPVVSPPAGAAVPRHSINKIGCSDVLHDARPCERACTHAPGIEIHSACACSTYK